MRRWTKSAIPRMGAFAAAIVTLGYDSRASTTLIVALRSPLLLSFTPIISTEPFDEFSHPTEFPLLNLNSFTYSSLTLIPP
jgi:hypothetical protein